MSTTCWCKRLFREGRNLFYDQAIVTLIVLTLSLISLNHNQALAQCMDISDIPMDTKVEAAPPNIMFVLDDSGSMDWEVMTGETDGKFTRGGTEYEYLFDDPGDMSYSTSDGNGTILSGTARGYYKSQCSGYNRIYYNPQSDYRPWPGMTNADTSNPRSNPADAAYTLDITAEYLNLVYYTNEVIVDEKDSNFSKTGPWGESGHSDGYNFYYWWTPDNSDYTAVWQPYLPVTGEYEVFARWYANSNRSQSVEYSINHSGGTTAVTKNQRLDSGSWNSLGVYTFNAGTSGSVSLDFHRYSDYERVCADAIKFAQQHDPISIKNAHYYTWNDTDQDGEMDSGETVYLVNFVSGAREYYEVNDTDGDEKVEQGELVEITELPDPLKPAFYDEEGNFVSYKTDAEDLQNFANWYSFYRKRELAAKAAVAHSIIDLEKVQVGLYTINSSSTRTPVLPVKVEMPATVIVDNKDSGYAEYGSWGESGASNEYRGSSRYTNSSGRYATWTPYIEEAGEYDVYAWWDYYSTRDENALYTVNHSGGSFTTRVNQRQDSNQWTKLGTFNFAAGTSGYVRVTRDGSSTGSSTSADAVMLKSTTGTANVDETNTLLGILYSINSSGGTPLRNGLNEVGKYYDQGSTSSLGASPYASEPDGGACQHAFAIVMTDGYWNGGNPSGVGNEDGGQGDKYEDDYYPTLADVAMKYYKKDLSDEEVLTNGLDDLVPTNSCDKAGYQHMVTYGVSFGVTGDLNPDDYHYCLLDGNAPDWPDPTTNCYACPKKIDDLYHAAINGRGLFFSASDPEELVHSLLSIVQNIESRTASGASVSVNGEELNEGTVLYLARYDSGDWTGEVIAFPVDPTTGEILMEQSDILWNSSDELQATIWSNRKIVTYNGTSSGTEFSFSSLTDAQKTFLDHNWTTDPATAEDMVEYIKGAEIAGFRSRTKKLGDIVHSAPLLAGNIIASSDGLDNDGDGEIDELGEKKAGTIYAGGNDGMLHAFNAENGRERFAYVPNLVFENLKYLTDLDYEHKFFVDLTPYAIRNVEIATDTFITMLVGGLKKGGKGYYALDITNSETITSATSIGDIANMVMWEYPKEGTVDDDMGYSYSKAYIVRSHDTNNEWVAIFGNGYDSVNGEAVLYILGVDGTVIRKIHTQVTGCNGLSTPALVDIDWDGMVDYVYAGDLKGNLWKFDLTNSDSSKWDSAYKYAPYT